MAQLSIFRTFLGTPKRALWSLGIVFVAFAAAFPYLAQFILDRIAVGIWVVFNPLIGPLAALAIAFLGFRIMFKKPK